MKHLRNVGILIFFLSIQSSFCKVTSQDGDAAGGLSYGAHLGTTISTFTNEQPHRSIVIDPSIGVHGIYTISDLFNVQVELNYLECGGGLVQFTDPTQLNTSPVFDSEVKDMKVSIRSVELPALFCYSLDLGDAKLSIMAGASAAWVFHAGNVSETTARYPSTPSVYTTFSGEENMTKDITPFIYNAQGGVSVEFPFISDMSMFVDVRYRQSINKVYKGYSYLGIKDVSSDLGVQSLSISLGVNL